ncbi:MAG: CRISPR-associated endonuclease Cas1 [Canidatus Methanoxibalbensis ujae]|nr:CRISPR-associated endonuclease Cas1 [Candidatus Methanoxibalbensis ujae]
MNPAISYLHEPFERRFSLALDIAEVFKPFLVDRVIFKLVNMNMLCDNDFVSDLNACLLNERGRSLLRNGGGWYHIRGKFNGTLMRNGINGMGEDSIISEAYQTGVL